MFAYHSWLPCFPSDTAALFIESDIPLLFSTEAVAARNFKSISNNYSATRHSNACRTPLLTLDAEC